MGVTFGNYHSKIDFNLDYLHKEVTAPEPKRTVVNIPLVHGSLDLTNRLTGNEPIYENRELNLYFEIRSLRAFWMLDYGNILEKIHGRLMNVIFDEDPNYYWRGVVTVGDLEDHGFTAGFPVTIDAFPFKWRTQADYVDTYTLGTAPTPDDYDATINVQYPVAIPEFDCSGVIITYREQKFTASGTHYTPPGMLFTKGTQTMNLYGVGDAKLYIRGGAL